MIPMGTLVIWRRDADTYMVAITPVARDPRYRLYRRDTISGTMIAVWVEDAAELAPVGRRRRLQTTTAP